jgi:hypothetical protein
LYGGSADNIGRDEFSNDEETSGHEKRRYGKGRKKILEIAIKLKDESYRDTALHAAFDFCMRAKDLQFAVMIAKAISVDTIQKRIVDEHPEYFLLDENDGRLRPIAAEHGPLLK